MFSKLFPVEEQPQNIQDEKGFRSRILAYTPEVMMMEWHFFYTNHVIPLHEHYHVSFLISHKAPQKLFYPTEQRNSVKQVMLSRLLQMKHIA